MAEPSPETNLALKGRENQVQAKVPSRGKKVAIAFVLSILVPGLGQLYGKRIWRGLIVALMVTGFDFAFVKSRAFSSFVEMMVFLSVGILLHLWIVGDACYIAWKGRAPQEVPDDIRLQSLAVGLVIFLLAGYPIPQFIRKGSLHIRAFRISSSSMCPTICEGERIITDTDSYLQTLPRRGDLIMFDFQLKHGPLYIKRVVGIGGDIVSEKNGVVLINGKSLTGVAPSQACKSLRATNSPSSEEFPRFESVTVPASSFFVVGDNSANSNDSRIPGFGFVTPDQIKGRPLYIYWSQDRSRVGCAVR